MKEGKESKFYKNKYEESIVSVRPFRISPSSTVFLPGFDCSQAFDSNTAQHFTDKWCKQHQWRDGKIARTSQDTLAHTRSVMTLPCYDIRHPHLMLQNGSQTFTISNMTWQRWRPTIHNCKYINLLAHPSRLLKSLNILKYRFKVIDHFVIERTYNKHCVVVVMSG